MSCIASEVLYYLRAGYHRGSLLRYNSDATSNAPLISIDVRPTSNAPLNSIDVKGRICSCCVIHAKYYSNYMASACMTYSNTVSRMQ